MYIATPSGKRNRLVFGLFLQNRDLRLDIRRLDVGDESPFEARAQTLFECGIS
jgi:hypothetical protein